MKYVIWTMDEEVALCKAIATKWREAGYMEVSTEHFSEVIRLAGAGTGEADSWRARVLKSRDARRFIEVRWSTLALYLAAEQPTTYEVPGYEQRMTAQQMQDEIVRLNAEIKALKEPPLPPQAPVAPIVTRPREECDGVYRPKELAPKKRVAIAGLHDKHRDNIARLFPHFDIKWIEPRDNDALIKSKASGRVTIACTYGTNGNVLKLLHNISKCYTVGGAHGVRDTLSNMQGNI
jgi:hypothetical protein